jgi:prepilin-type N-terminal cleavage/methylation domain-containing protein
MTENNASMKQLPIGRNAMKKQQGFTLSELLAVLFMLAIGIGGGIGWIWNIVKLIGMGLDPITGLLIVRAVGIFVFPIGMVVGYI